MSKKRNENRSELKLTARTLNILINNLGMLVSCLEIPSITCLEIPTIIPSKLSGHCQEMQEELIVYRAKVFQMLEMGA